MSINEVEFLADIHDDSDIVAAARRATARAQSPNVASGGAKMHGLPIEMYGFCYWRISGVT